MVFTSRINTLDLAKAWQWLLFVFLSFSFASASVLRLTGRPQAPRPSARSSSRVPPLTIQARGPTNKSTLMEQIEECPPIGYSIHLTKESLYRLLSVAGASDASCMYINWYLDCRSEEILTGRRFVACQFLVLYRPGEQSGNIFCKLWINEMKWRIDYFPFSEPRIHSFFPSRTEPTDCQNVTT